MGEVVLNLQGKMNQFAADLSTNLASQKEVEGNIQYAEWEKYAAKNSFFSKAVIQDREKDFPRQAKYKGVHDH